MPSVRGKRAGRGYKHLPDKQFRRWDSNTICDVTGFRVKFSDVMRRWEGWYVIGPAWNPRQPQDFPVVPTKQHVIREARKGDADREDIAVTPPTFPIV